MKYNIKIGITPAKFCYSCCFVILLALIRGVSTSDEIGGALDANVALLSLIFCSDTYYQEIMADRWEVFYLLPVKSKFLTICQRLFVQISFIILLISLGYWIFFIQGSTMNINDNVLYNYLIALLACSASVVFFGVLSVTFVNLFRNLWAGIGCTLAIWITLNSTLGKKLPDYINVFAYGGGAEKTSIEWVFGKLTAILISVLLILLNRKLIIRQGKVR